MRIVVVDPDTCVACRNCEYACAFRQNGSFDRSASHIRVNFYPKERASVPLTCMHCAEAWCMEVCPAAAISRNPETGAVEIDAARCAGCKMCMLACPYGNIHFDAVASVSRKCDLCGGDPMCVRACTAGSLQFIEEEVAFDFRRETVDAKLRRALNLDRRED